MRFAPLRLPGAFEIEICAQEDERGFFARTWCAEEFRAQGLCGELAQCSLSFNPRKGTLRGMHYQAAPHAEAKLVRCTQGSIYDVLLDLRESSPTFRQWVSLELSSQNRRMVYIPPGVAHGFQTLEGDSEVFYQISERYYPELARGVRWDDPAFGIAWPEAKRIIGTRDRQYPDFVV